MWQFFLDFYGYAVFFYSLGLIISYVVLMILAYRGLFQSTDNMVDDYAYRVVERSPYTPGVSIVAPAYNEEKTVVDNIKSLLKQKYPKFEVVIVNDGSKDSTLETMITNFDMVPVDFAYVEYLQTKPFKRLYRSTNPLYEKLIVVDKENGGTKADPINTGINVASYDYFINTDVDCILTEDAIYQCMLPVMRHNNVIAVSGMMTMSTVVILKMVRSKNLPLPRIPSLSGRSWNTFAPSLWERWAGRPSTPCRTCRVVSACSIAALYLKQVVTPPTPLPRIWTYCFV